MDASLRDISLYLKMRGAAPEGALAGRIEAMRAKALRAARPASVWRRFQIEDGFAGAGAARMAVSGSLARHMAGCRSAVLVCGTLGAGYDAFHRAAAAISAADALIVQAIGAALMENAMDAAEDGIRHALAPGERMVRRYSPGFGDFPLSAGRDILALLDAPLKIGVSMTESMLMVPSKSVSAVIGILPPDAARAAD